MAKSRGRKFAEITSPTSGVFDLTSVPTITNAKLQNSAMTLAGSSVSLGGTGVADTDALSEGSSNLYFTNARVQSFLGGGTLAGNIVVPDNISIYLGSDSDFRLVHNTTNTQLINATGALQITSNGGFAVTGAATFSSTGAFSGTSLTVGSSQEVNIVSSGHSLFPSLKVNNNGYIGSASATQALQITTAGQINTIGDIVVTKSSAKVEVTESSGASVRMIAGGSTGYIGNYSNHSLQILTNSTPAITIDNSQNATFASAITATGGVITGASLKAHVGTDTGTQLNLFANGSGHCFIAGHTLTFNTGANNNRIFKAIIDASGNVGINDPSPDRKVSIIGDSTSNGQYPLSLDATNTDYALEFRRSGTSEWWIKASASNFTVHENGVGDQFSVYSGSARVHGLLGVNKGVNAAVALSVGSDASTTSSYGLEVCNSSSNTRFLVDGEGSSFFYKTDNALAMKFNASTGRLGLGVGTGLATPSAALHIDQVSNDRAGGLYIERNGSSYGLAAYVDSSGYAVLGGGGSYSNDVIRMDINTRAVSLGGVATPTYLLDMQGAIGDGTPLIRGTATGTPANGFNWVTEFMAANLAAGRRTSHVFGRARSSGASGHISYYESTVDDNNNQVQLGMYGANDILNVTYNRRVGINTSTPAVPLHLYGGTTSAQLQIEGAAGNYIYMGNDNSGTYMENVATAAARRQIRIQASNGSGAYTQLFVDGGNKNVQIVAPAAADFLITSQQFQIVGGIGAKTTSGTTNWNDSTNARSGNGYTLLRGSDTNGPGTGGDYWHAFTFEYNYKDGTGNMTQIAIPYGVASGTARMRSRYGGTWSSWITF